MTETVWLQRPGADVPWGFRLHGGRDYQTPLTVQKVTPGSIAATGLAQGDVILRIGESDTPSLTYAQAMDVIKNSGNLLQLSIAKRGGQGTYSPQVDAANNMSSSGALHDLFQDMYRYSDTYAQEGAQSHTQPAPAPAPSYSYQPSYPAGGGSAPQDPHSAGSLDQYGRQPQYSTGSDPYQQQYSNIGAGASPAPPSQAPPTYTDVQTQRDHVAYPYQPTPAPTTPSYPYQPTAAHPASNSYQYPHSVSSSTSELSDISSGFGASDGKPSGTSPALGRPMISPPTGGVAKPYTSGGSSMDSSSGPSQPTRLEQQLANMNMEPDYGRQNSYPYQSPQSPSHPPGAPAPPPPPPAQAPYYGGSRTPTSPAAPPAPRPQHVIPDAVLNMAAKGGSDKKPFTYAPDTESIKEQRDKVRRSLKKDQGQDVTQSPVYRMIHGLDSDRNASRPVNKKLPSEGHRGPRAPDDEMCFSGVLDRSDIPSKSFHRLQNMTGGSDIDTTSIRHNVSGDAPEEEIGCYDQASIRYTGKNIPSKSFRMLQSMTGDNTSGSELTVPSPQRRQRRQRPEPQPTEPEQNPDDIVDISYVGANIPSRSFKVLQHAVGGDDSTDAAPQSTAPLYGGTHQNGQSQGRTVKVIKLRQQQPEQHHEPSGVTDF